MDGICYISRTNKILFTIHHSIYAHVMIAIYETANAPSQTYMSSMNVKNSLKHTLQKSIELVTWAGKAIYKHLNLDGLSHRPSYIPRRTPSTIHVFCKFKLEAAAALPHLR